MFPFATPTRQISISIWHRDLDSCRFTGDFPGTRAPTCSRIRHLAIPVSRGPRTRKLLSINTASHDRIHLHRTRFSLRAASVDIATASKQPLIWRDRENKLQDGLLTDEYAKALFSDNTTGGGTAAEAEQEDDVASLQYLLVTRFLDDQILYAAASGVKQVVLLSDGLDTRPYRLLPSQPITFFDVSPAPPFSLLSSRMQAIGARPAPGSVLRHVSADLSSADDWRDEGWGEKLQRLGYRGDKPSLWVMQGVPHVPPDALTSILGHVRGLAMSGSSFIGELPLSALACPDTESATSSLLSSALASAGFLSSLLPLPSIALSLTHRRASLIANRLQQLSSLHAWPPANHSVVFAASQQRLSDAQVEFATAQIHLAEEAGDEEGFEDMP